MSTLLTFGLQVGATVQSNETSKSTLSALELATPQGRSEPFQNNICHF